jgi:glutaredoxin
MKKLLALGAAGLLFACGSDAADVTLYYMPGCPYCHNAIDFFDKEGIAVEKVNVTEGGRAMERFGDALKKCNSQSRGVPLIIVKGECLQGFAPEVGDKIKTMLGK